MKQFLVLVFLLPVLLASRAADYDNPITTNGPVEMTNVIRAIAGATINTNFQDNTINSNRLDAATRAAVGLDTVGLIGRPAPTDLLKITQPDTGTTATMNWTNFVAAVSGYLNVLDFGAKGDGVHDDTDAIQNAVITAALKFRAIYFPPGIYLVKHPIGLKPHIVLVGPGGIDNNSGAQVGPTATLKVAQDFNTDWNLAVATPIFPGMTHIPAAVFQGETWAPDMAVPARWNFRSIGHGWWWGARISGLKFELSYKPGVGAIYFDSGDSLIFSNISISHGVAPLIWITGNNIGVNFDNISFWNSTGYGFKFSSHPYDVQRWRPSASHVDGSGPPDSFVPHNLVYRDTNVGGQLYHYSHGTWIAGLGSPHIANGSVGIRGLGSDGVGPAAIFSSSHISISVQNLYYEHPLSLTDNIVRVDCDPAVSYDDADEPDPTALADKQKGRINNASRWGLSSPITFIGGQTQGYVLRLAANALYPFNIKATGTSDPHKFPMPCFNAIGMQNSIWPNMLFDETRNLPMGYREVAKPYGIWSYRNDGTPTTAIH